MLKKKLLVAALASSFRWLRWLKMRLLRSQAM